MTGIFSKSKRPSEFRAPAPELHIDAVAARADWFLQTSPELCMKRLLAAGYPRTFQISHCFRAGERGSRHLPEFTMLEWYRAETDYRTLMDDCETLIARVAAELVPGRRRLRQGRKVDLTPPWERITVREAFARYAPLTVEGALRQDRFDEIMVSSIEPHLGGEHPVFLYEYPAVLGALARVKPDDPGLAERFELYIASLELANAFSELTDAAEQRRRFEEATRAPLAEQPFSLSHAGAFSFCPLPDAPLRGHRPRCGSSRHDLRQPARNRCGCCLPAGNALTRFPYAIIAGGLFRSSVLDKARLFD